MRGSSLGPELSGPDIERGADVPHYPCSNFSGEILKMGCHHVCGRLAHENTSGLTSQADLIALTYRQVHKGWRQLSSKGYSCEALFSCISIIYTNNLPPNAKILIDNCNEIYQCDVHALDIIICDIRRFMLLNWPSR